MINFIKDRCQYIIDTMEKDDVYVGSADERQRDMIKAYSDGVNPEDFAKTNEAYFENRRIE